MMLQIEFWILFVVIGLTLIAMFAFSAILMLSLREIGLIILGYIKREINNQDRRFSNEQTK